MVKTLPVLRFSNKMFLKLKRMIQKHTFSLLSYLRRAKANKDGLAPVYLRITLDGKRAELSAQTFVDPAKWNPQKGRLKASY